MDEENRLQDLIFFLLRGLSFLAVALIFVVVLMFASKADKFGIENVNKIHQEESQYTDAEHATEAEEQFWADMPVGKMNEQYAVVLDRSLPDDLYTLRYEDAVGVMDSYTDICSLRPGETYDKFIMQNTAPQTAVRMAVLNSDGEQVGHIPFDPSFRPELGGKLYSFAVLSDVHIGYETAEDDFKNALTYLSRQTNVDFVCITGDLTAACTDEQLVRYKYIVDNYAGDLSVYAVTGNHDTEQYRKSNISDTIEKYTGHPMYYSGTKNQDVFLFLGTYNGYDTGRAFTRDQLQWLYEKLETNRNQRCFIFEHIRPDNTSGNPHDLQSVDLWGGTEAEVFESLLKHYPNVTVFHGHTHTALALQEDLDIANYDSSLGCHSVHVPALVGTRELDQYGYKINDDGASEGCIVDVYENALIIRGFDFVQRKNIPVATYCLDTTVQTLEANTYTDQTMTIHCETIIPEWNYQTVFDEKDGSAVATKDYSSTELIPVEQSNAYFVHQYWNCPYAGQVCYYDEDGRFLERVIVWDNSGYAGPVRLDIPEEAVSFRIVQWTSNDEEHHTKDIFVTYKPTEN